MRVGFGGGNAFKVGCWTPVRIQVKAGPQRFSGFLDLVVPDDDGIPTSTRQPLEVAANETTALTAYSRPGGRDTEFTVRIVDQQGRRVVEAPQAVTLPAAPEAILPDELLILTLGQPLGVDQVPNLPGFTSGGRNRTGPAGAGVSIARIDAQQNQLPGRWLGYDAAHAIVIDTEDRAALQSLDGLRGEALVDWVRHGGHLVVAVGGNWQAVIDSPLGPILPAQPAGQERVPALDAIDNFAGSIKPLTPAGTPPVMVTKLEAVKERGGKPLTSVTSSLPLIVRGPHGFGRVTLIGVGVNQNIFGEWPDRGVFWARALDLRHDQAERSGGGVPLGGSARFYQSGVSDLASQLRISLEQFPGVKLIPFGWVAFFIFLYILLIGPGDYFFLKKVLKRMELTWITFPAIVITVSLLAYFAAYRLKGNDLLVNKVDVIDVDQPAGLVRGRTVLSLFSPQNRDYNIGFVPVSPASMEEDVSPLASTGAADESPRSSRGTRLETTWFSIPEAQFGGMSGANRRFSFIGSGYSYEPTGGMERLENVRVPIWSTRAVTARWLGPGSSPIESELRPMGTDSLAGTVTNHHRFPIEDALLAYGKQVYMVGTLAPGASVKVELSPVRTLAGHLRERASGYAIEQGWNRNARINRAELLLAMMFRDSETNRGGAAPLGNATLHDMDLTGQLALDRPMLVGRIKRPGAQLVLENAPSTPKIDQTTMIRVILPLKKNTGDGKRAAQHAAPFSQVANLVATR